RPRRAAAARRRPAPRRCVRDGVVPPDRTRAGGRACPDDRGARGPRRPPPAAARPARRAAGAGPRSGGRRAMSPGAFLQRLSRGPGRLRQRPDWARFAGPDWPDRIMQVSVTDRFLTKQGRTTGRLVLDTGEQRLVVYLKRHYRQSWWRGLLAAVWP